MEINLADLLTGIGVITSLFIALRAFRATKADVISKMEDALSGAITTIVELQAREVTQDAQIKLLRGRIRVLENAEALLRTYIARLLEQMRDNEIEPVKPPADLDIKM